MSAKVGLVGLPNAGKSSLFNALARASAQVAPYPFTTIDQNVGVAAVDDPRLQKLAAVVPHDKIVPTSLDVVDIAGLVKGAHQGEGLGNQFLSHVLAVDALLHLVRCFGDPDVPHPMGEIDPARDVEIVNTELLLKDLELVNRRLEKERKIAKGGDKTAQAHVERLTVLKTALEQGTPIRRLALDPMAHPKAMGLELLSAKPVIYVANVDEAALRAPTDAVKRLAEVAAREDALLVPLCVRLEAE
ncbi:MAG: redox-regulated ATPase YchF, partial [Candidatus Omnitrophica bacterium]|nr:redox-regulated ATPase YchF [Candidatus Omnitrophota bacterium]